MTEHRIDDVVWQPTETLSELVATGFGDAVAELIDDFDTDTTARLQRLRVALARDDSTVVRKEAHSIKGSALQMGASRVASTARLIETAEPYTVHSGTVEDLEAAFRDARRDMRAYLERRQLRAG
jgi:HPt (histidine-containing phosphotransfer) domain-containing protein